MYKLACTRMMYKRKKGTKKEGRPLWAALLFSGQSRHRHLDVLAGWLDLHDFTMKEALDSLQAARLRTVYRYDFTG